MKTPRLTPEETQRELGRLRALAQQAVARMPYAYQDWGVTRTRAYVRKLELLNRALASTDKRKTRVITKMRKAFGALDEIATTSNVEALQKLVLRMPA